MIWIPSEQLKKMELNIFKSPLCLSIMSEVNMKFELDISRFEFKHIIRWLLTSQFLKVTSLKLTCVCDSGIMKTGISE